MSERQRANRGGSTGWDLDRLREERHRLGALASALADDAVPAGEGWTADRLRVAHDRLTEVLVVLATDPLPADASGATGQAAVEIRDHRRRFECLHLALGGLVDQAVELGAAEAAALLRRPVRVVFTAATHDPAQIEELTVVDVVAAARSEVAAVRRILEDCVADLATLAGQLREAGDGIRALSQRYRVALLARLPAVTDPIGHAHDRGWYQDVAALCAEARVLKAAEDLRAAIAALRSLFAQACAEQLGDGVDPFAKLGFAPLLGRLDVLEPDWRDGRQWDVESADGLFLEMTAATREADAARRRLRKQVWSELNGLLEVYRQMAADEERGEEPGLLSLHQEAVELLHARPFGIPPAAAAVRAYIRAVNEERG